MSDTYLITAHTLVETTPKAIKFRVWRPFPGGSTIETAVAVFPRSQVRDLRPSDEGDGFDLELPGWLLEDRNIAGLHHGTALSWQISTPPPARLPRHSDLVAGLVDQVGEQIRETGGRGLKTRLTELLTELAQAIALEAVGVEGAFPMAPTRHRAHSRSKLLAIVEEGAGPQVDIPLAALERLLAALDDADMGHGGGNAQGGAGGG